MLEVLTVQVTQEDIFRGVRSNSEECPIARALRRKTGSAQVNVEGPTATVNGDRYLMDTTGRNFIQRFDADRWVKPVEILLRKVDELCPHCGQPFATFRRGQVRSFWRALFRRPSWALICYECRGIVGWEPERITADLPINSL